MKYFLPLLLLLNTICFADDHDHTPVAAKYFATLNQSVGTSPTLIKYDSRSLDIGDPYSAYNSSTGIFTVPEPGIYHVIVNSQTSPLSSAVGMQAYVYKNGVEIEAGPATASAGISGADYAPNFNDDIRCNTGDALAIYIYSTVATTLLAAPTTSYVTFLKVSP